MGATGRRICMHRRHMAFDIQPFFCFDAIGSQSEGVDNGQKVTTFENRPKAKVIVQLLANMVCDLY